MKILLVELSEDPFSSDLRFLSIDFLNTFLLTYRVFTDGETVLNALKKVFYEGQPVRGPTGEPINGERLNIPGGNDGNLTQRRTSGASSVSGKLSLVIFQTQVISIDF